MVKVFRFKEEVQYVMAVLMNFETTYIWLIMNGAENYGQIIELCTKVFQCSQESSGWTW